MLKTFKKAVALLLAVCLMLSFGVVTGAEGFDRVRSQLEGLGLMQGYEDGTFGENDALTRAQMATIVARILQVEGLNVGSNSFSDVSENHWAYEAINTLSGMGILNGMGDGTFMPDKDVNCFEALKMIVTVLGYEQFAKELGGYPSGYTVQAGKLGLLKGVNAEDNTITRGDVATILYNALSIKPLGGYFTQNYPVATYTLYEVLTESKNLVRFTGVLTETANASLTTIEPALKDGYVIIGGIRLKTDILMDEYLGYELIVYAQVDDNSRPTELKRFTVSSNTTVVSANADSVTWSGNTAIIEDAEGSEEELKVLANPKTLYNGRLASISADNRDIFYGSYTFIDNDADTVADVLRIDEAQSFIVDKVNADKLTVYFKNNATLNGKRAVVLDDTIDEKTVTILDKEGNTIAASDIEPGDGITLFASTDSNYVKAVISKDSVSGKITATSTNGIQIDDVEYQLAKKPDGSDNFTPQVGENGTYTLDCYGKVVGSSGVVVDSYQYAYVIDAHLSTNISKVLSLQTISGTEPRKEVTTSGDTEKITYYFQNDTVKVYECAESLIYHNKSEEVAAPENPATGRGTRVKSTDLDTTKLSRCIIAFRTNNDGKIIELHTYDVSQSASLRRDHIFNAKAMTFGGANLSRGYATDENTKFICIPSGNSAEISDYYVQVRIADKSTKNLVDGTVFIPNLDYADPDAEPVDVLLIQAYMNASSAPVPSSTDDICIVGSVNRAIGTIGDDAGAVVYEFELLNGKNVIKIATSSAGEAYDIATTLRKGDLIRYVKDGFGRIAGIKKIYSTQGLENNFNNNIYTNTGEPAMYGYIYDVITDSYDFATNDYIDKLYLSFEEDGGANEEPSMQRAPKLNGPPVYHYNRSSGWITPGSLEDVTASAYAGEEASKAFILLKSSDSNSSEIAAIVIIED